MNFLFTHIEPWIWLAALFAFLLAYAVATVIIVNKKRKTATAGRITMLYMALKVVRLLIFLSIVLAYVLIVKIEFKRFVVVAMMMYLVYLLLDTLFLTFTKKRSKKK